MPTIDDLFRRTDAIAAAMVDARSILEYGVLCNGFGILADPAATHSDLVAVQAKIAEALQLLRETRWPPRQSMSVWRS